MKNQRLAKTPNPLFKNWERHSNLLAEGLFSLLAIIGLLLFIALVSYSPSDAIWSEGYEPNMVSNVGGVIGAWLADFFFKLFGLPAFTISIALIWLGWNIHLSAKNEVRFNAAFFILRFISFMVLLCFISTVFAQNLSSDAGGWVGASIHHFFYRGFSDTSIILYVAIIVLSFSLSSGISAFQLFSKTGELLFSTSHYVHNYIATNKQHALEKRQAKRSKKEREDLYKSTAAKPKSTPTISPPKPSKPVIKAAPVQQTLFQSGDKNKLPPLSLLSEVATGKQGYTKETLGSLASQVELKLKDFGLDVEVATITPGPVVTQFEISLAPGVKVSQINGLSKDLARALLVESVRIVDVIPGKPYIGVEIPNAKRETISLRKLLSAESFKQSASPLSLALGEDINGEGVFVDLAKMPHLLIAGATGMGKSVGLNAMILSILYKSTPDEVRMIMIDPKVVELSSYIDVPHLITPVITDMNQAANALRWCVSEMERRYQLLAKFNIRNLAGFNKKAQTAQAQGTPLTDPFFDPETADADETPSPLAPLPLIVVMIDEYADMLSALAQDDRSKAKKVEALIVRLGQKARAAGIHLIVATQRPSVDVITGLIKSNIPTRIAFKVASKTDSRTILDQGGAEQLLGLGDMLYMAPGMRQLTRVHGAFVDDDEVIRVIDYLKQHAEPDYLDEVINPSDAKIGEYANLSHTDGTDELYDEAIKIVTTSRRASISSVQRQLRIGYNRAARMIETMEADGIVSTIGDNGQREVLAPPPIDID